MKPHIKCVILAIIFSILVTACSSNKNSFNLKNSSSSNSNIITDTSVKASTSSTKIITPSENNLDNNISSAMDAYKTVLENKVKFYNIENKKEVYLNDFLTNENIFVGITFKINEFAVVDMDGDQIPEIVLKLTVGEDPDFSEVLHYINGKVYGYFFVKNNIWDLKTDGTFRWLSGGLMYNGYGKLILKTNTCEIDNLAYLDSKRTDKSYTTSYYINNKLVTADLYQAFVKEEDAKKDAEWYEFSEENISAVISKATEKQDSNIMDMKENN